MNMETLTEITGAELKRRQRAMTYESLQGDVAKLRSEIKRLEAQTFDCTALEQILELASQIPAGILTQSRSSLGLSIPSGIGGRLAVMQATEAALSDGRRREADRVAAVKEVKAKLAKAEKDLESFE
jgi:hypothetical protein